MPPAVNRTGPLRSNAPELVSGGEETPPCALPGTLELAHSTRGELTGEVIGEHDDVCEETTPADAEDEVVCAAAAAAGVDGALAGTELDRDVDAPAVVAAGAGAFDIDCCSRVMPSRCS